MWMDIYICIYDELSLTSEEVFDIHSGAGWQEAILKETVGLLASK